MRTEEQLERKRAQGRAYYRRNKSAVTDRFNKRIGPRKQWLKEYKEARPCADCGNKFPAECMDFDHLPGKIKRCPIAHLLGCSSLDDVKAEMEKCELVCACCHRTRTLKRKSKI